MKNQLKSINETFDIIWDDECLFIDQIKSASELEGIANNIGGEVFFYQSKLDIPFNGQERDVFDYGDVVYWRSQKEVGKFGILFMYGNTSFGDGTKARTSSPGVKIGHIVDYQRLANIETSTNLMLG